jgi:hypothetical protein
LQRGRTECVPPRRSPLASSPGCPADAREDGITPTTRSPPFWPPASRQLAPNHDLPRFTSTALPNGRTERIPPRKRPSALSPGFSTPGDPRWGWPRRGGAGSARPPCLRPAIWDPTEAHPSGENPSSLILSLYPRRDPPGLLPVFKFPRIPEVRWNGLAPFGACGHGDWAVSLTRTEEGSRTGDFCSMG